MSLKKNTLLFHKSKSHTVDDVPRDSPISIRLLCTNTSLITAQIPLSVMLRRRFVISGLIEKLKNRQKTPGKGHKL